MLPYFSNPHFLPQTLETISRAKIYADDEEDVNSTLQVDPKAIERLNRLINHSLPKIRYGVSSALDAGNKYQTSDTKEDIKTEEEYLVLFRLVSSSQPALPLSLLPPPPPPSKTREPDAEDTEERALLRKQRAGAASVDGADILRESLILMASPHASKETIHMQGILDTEPGMMIVRTLQSPRKTRPPVPSSQLSHFPYVPDKSKMSIKPASSKIPKCLTIGAELVPSQAPARNSRPRRRRGVLVKKEHPPPQFWRPDPALKGKCRGYAYGYPSNLSLAESYANGGGNRPWSYRRDTMKKGTYLDSSTATQVTYGYGPNQC